MQVHTERDILVALEFPRELYISELFRSVVLGAEFHARVTHNHKALARLFVCKCRPLDIGALARFANFHVHDGHRVCIRRIKSHEATAVTSDVVFVRAATKVTDLFVAARNREERTHVRQIALGAIRVERVFHNDIATAVNRVRKLHAGAADIRETEIERHLRFASGNFLDFGSDRAVVACLAPFAMAAFHVEALVVINRGAPEVRTAAVLDNRIAIKNVACKRTGLFVKLNLEIRAFNRETIVLSDLVGLHGAHINFSRPELA